MQSIETEDTDTETKRACETKRRNEKYKSKEITKHNLSFIFEYVHFNVFN